MEVAPRTFAAWIGVTPPPYRVPVSPGCSVFPLTGALRRLSQGNRASIAALKKPALSVQMDSSLAAALTVLSDGKPRKAAEIVADAVKLGLLQPTTRANSMESSLKDYISRTLARGNKPFLVQNPIGHLFRINHPADDWPTFELPPRPRYTSKVALDALDILRREGYAQQRKLVCRAQRADMPVLTLDAATILVEVALQRDGASVGVSRAEIQQAMSELIHADEAAVVPGREGIIIRRGNGLPPA